MLAIPRSSTDQSLHKYFDHCRFQVEVPADMCYPIFFGIVSYFATGVNRDVRAFFLYTVIIVLNVVTASSIGLFVASVMMNASQALVVCSGWVLVSLATSGFLLDPDNIPGFLKFTRYLSFMRVSNSSSFGSMPWSWTFALSVAQ